MFYRKLKTVRCMALKEYSNLATAIRDTDSNLNVEIFEGTLMSRGTIVTALRDSNGALQEASKLAVHCDSDEEDEDEDF